MLLSRSASSKRLTGGSLLSSRVSAGASFAPSAASAVAALSVLSPVHADSASATASERSRACGFLTVTWVSGPVRALDGKKHAGPPGGFGHRNTIPPRPAGRGCRRRSEEHTSELQSLMRISYAVFCLKKKKKHKTK